MLVSILMPVYNAGPYLDSCLNSILGQTHRQWELIAVDDHSTDASWDKLCFYQQQDDRIKIFRNPGRGIIDALRLALQKSRGTFITRMDADDVMATDKLAELLIQLQKKGPGYLSTGMVAYFSDRQLGEGYQKYARWLNRLTEKGQHYQHIYRECVIPSPCWMIARKDLVRCGAFDADRYPEDYDLCFRFYQHGIKIAGSQELLHYWRDHGDRASRNQEIYADNFFIELKMYYFLLLDHEPERSLVLWGAGKKGKRMARELQSASIPFTWVCDNPKKWGLDIYDQALYSPKKITALKQPQILIAVASPAGQAEIRGYVHNLGLKEGKDFFFFC